MKEQRCWPIATAMAEASRAARKLRADFTGWRLKEEMMMPGLFWKSGKVVAAPLTKTIDAPAGASIVFVKEFS